MRYSVFDLESDEFLDKNTLIHCLSYQTFENGQLIAKGTFTDYDSMRRWVRSEDILVGHNIKTYDIPTITKILGVEVLSRLIDTLALSWYLYPMQKEHGLEHWGEILGVAKPTITDWKNLTLEEYVFRCETDVEINVRLFKKQLAYLNLIYHDRGIDNIMSYLTWKQDCMIEQWQNPLRIDKKVAKENYDKILPEIEKRNQSLASVMPKVVKYELKKIPKKPYKQDGQLSALGEKWFNLLFDLNLPADTQSVKVVKGEEEPNPSSVPQIKAWLFSLGWEPTIFKYEKDDNGKVRAIPQLNDKDKNLCEDIIRLAQTYPEVKNLQGIYMLKHRLGILKGFLELSDEEGYIRAETLGFTNTLRFKHKNPIVNLPTVGKPYGKEIRSCIIAPSDDHLFCGSDMTALEDTTKQHYIYFYDPEYVKEMRQPGFDPHISMGVFAGMLTPDDEAFFKWYNAKLDEDPNHEFTPEQKARFKHISGIRKDSKQVNFSAVYGVGAKKLSLGTKWPLEKSQGLLDIYWDRNKAVKQIAADCLIRVVFKNGTTANYMGASLMALKWGEADAFFATVEQMWLYNPVSEMFYSLRYPKDIFSTLNQGTGVYCFDTQVKNVRKQGIKISLQYHDEKGFPLLKTEKEEVRQKLYTALKQTNEELKLNVPLGISVEFGPNYAECH